MQNNIASELCKPEQRHIVSVFKVIQELLAPSKVKNKNQFQLLIEKLPSEHKAKWFADAALNTAEQSMNSVMSTALSRLNAFLDSELEQILCFNQQLYREILAVADEQGGKLKNRVMMYLDEFGTLPRIESAEMMFSASRSRRVSICAIIRPTLKSPVFCWKQC